MRPDSTTLIDPVRSYGDQVMFSFYRVWMTPSTSKATFFLHLWLLTMCGVVLFQFAKQTFLVVFEIIFETDSHGFEYDKEKFRIRAENYDKKNTLCDNRVQWILTCFMLAPGDYALKERRWLFFLLCEDLCILYVVLSNCYSPCTEICVLILF